VYTTKIEVTFLLKQQVQEMYGLVLNVIKDLVKTKWGSETWIQILAEACTASDDWDDLTVYGDAIAHALAAAAAKVGKRKKVVEH
jgi:hypothetical protein